MTKQIAEYLRQCHQRHGTKALSVEVALKYLKEFPDEQFMAVACEVLFSTVKILPLPDTFENISLEEWLNQEDAIEVTSGSSVQRDSVQTVSLESVQQIEGSISVAKQDGAMDVKTKDPDDIDVIDPSTEWMYVMNYGYDATKSYNTLVTQLL